MRVATSMPRRFLVVPLALLFWLVPATPLAAQPRSPVVAQSCPGEYVIGREDVLDIAVWGNAELTRTVPVRPDGKISLPLLNDLAAAGMTPMQLRDSLTKALSVYMPGPAVSVIVREVHSFKITVIGQVKTPNRYEVKDRPTVLDVLAMAGGFTDYAARGDIVIFRQEGGVTRQIPFAFDKLATKGGSKNGGQENFCLTPGDIILVP